MKMLKQWIISSFYILSTTSSIAAFTSNYNRRQHYSCESTISVSKTYLNLSFPKTITTTTKLFTTSPQQQQTAEEKEELTKDKVAELIEVSFINACLQLSTGYIDVLKLFIVAVKAGYELGLPYSEIAQAVKACPIKSANRDLMVEEEQLRELWIKLIYTSMAQLTSNDKNRSPLVDSIDSNFQNEFLDFVKAAIEVRQKDIPWKEVPIGDIVGKLNTSDNKPSSLIYQKTILAHCAHLVYLTLTVINEEKLCEDDFTSKKESVKGKAGPFIAGRSGSLDLKNDNKLEIRTNTIPTK